MGGDNFLQRPKSRRIEPGIALLDAIFGVTFEALDERLMIRSLTREFCSGEMLDWEALTGGYLLTASFASGGVAALAWPVLWYFAD